MTKDDTGTYVCKGTNGFGSTEAQIDLIVIGKQDILHFSTYIFTLWAIGGGNCFIVS